MRSHRSTSERYGAGEGGRLAEQAVLTRRPLLLADLGLAERVVQRRDELGAVSTQRVTGTGVDERFDHALVAEAQVDAVAQLHE